MAKVPAYISHTVLVHAGSYKDFLNKLGKEYPNLLIKFVKKEAIHYYILQLEDHSEPAITKQQIYNLPIMALREEFSNFIFFKNTKSYNNVLKRMCGAPGNINAAYNLLQNMMTPFEKAELLKLETAKTLGFEEESDKKDVIKVTYYDNKEMFSLNVLNKLFSLKEVTVDGEQKVFSDLVKKGTKWVIGIH